MDSAQLETITKWAEESLTKKAKLINGFAFKPDDWKKEGLPIVRIEHLAEESQFTDFTTIPESKLILLQDGDIVFSWSGSLVVLKWVKGKAALNQHLFLVKSESLSYDFLYHLLTYHLQFLELQMHGSTMKHLTRRDLDKYLIRFPIDENEQSAIAKILTTVDGTISATKAKISKLEAIKTGMLQDLLTHGIDENGQIRNPKTHRYKKVPDYGWVPEEWEVKSINGIADHVSSGVTPKGGSDVYVGSGVMLVRSQNVLSGGFDLSDVAYITDEINSQMKRSQLQSFDILLNITGASIGRSHFVPSVFPKANVNQHVAAIRLKSASLAKSSFMSYLINSHTGQNQINRLLGASNRAGLNFKQIREIRFAFPRLESDNEFIAINSTMSSVERQLSKLNFKLSKLQFLKSGLMQDILTGKVRVPKNLISNP